MFNPSFKNLRAVICICTAFAFTSAPLSARVFTNNKGRTIGAEIVSVDKGKVTLKLLKSKKDYILDISSLSKKDQDYIQEWSKKQAAEKKAQASKKSESKSNKETSIHGEYSYAALKKQYKLSDNFDKDWPSIASAKIPDIVIVKEDDENNKYVYHSNNYEFICDVKLSKNVVNKFAHLFEATMEYCKAMPISMLKAHLPKGQKKYRILLFETDKAYFKNGGPHGSAGVYSTEGDVIMVPLSSLGVKKSGSTYRYDYKGANGTLPHEITHQLTNPEYYSHGSDGWFSEGLAEYVSMTDYRSGKFMIRGNLKNIKDAVTGFSKKTDRGRNIGKKFTAPDLKGFMTMPYSKFTAKANFNYGLGALITYYFLHLEEDRSNINAFLKALNEGKEGEDALKVLRNGRSFDELEKDIHKAWKSKGVEINFR